MEKMVESSKRRRISSLFMIGIILMIAGFLVMGQRRVVFDDNHNPLAWYDDPLFLIVGTIVYLWGVISICYLVWKTGTNPTVDDRHLFLIRKILRKQYSTPDLKHIGNELTIVGLIITAVGILGSPALMLFVSSVFPVGRPQGSYVPTLLIIIFGLIMALSGFWIKWLALAELDRDLSKIHNHSQISSWHLSTGNLSALDAVSVRRDLTENKRSEHRIKSLMIIMILVGVVALNPLISPVEGIHDSDLDGYANAVDTSSNDPRYWGGNEPININLEVGENVTDWLIVVKQVDASRQVDANEIFIQIRMMSNDTYQSIYQPLIALSDASSLYSIGVHFLDSVPQGSLNIGDQIALNKSTYNLNTIVILTDQTGAPQFGFVMLASIL
jgi:hypothetical protein